MEEKKELLRIEHLTVSFAQYEKRSAKQGELPVIRDLNVTVREGEIVAVVGSSGSGKSLLAHAIMGILPANAAASGSIFYRGSACGEAELKALRGREIALVPQSVNYLDPLMKVGRQIIGETKKRQKLFAEQTGKSGRRKRGCGNSLQGMGLRTKLRISIRLNYPVAWRAVCFY
ncbi:MAG: ATP-binding cassette domain-containing protein [Roseburia hominis]